MLFHPLLENNGGWDHILWGTMKIGHPGPIFLELGNEGWGEALAAMLQIW